MTTLARITIALILALFVSSCAFDMNFGEGKKGNGIVAEDNRNVSEEFTEVSASEGLDVFVTQSNVFKIVVEADENIIDLIGTDIKNGKLTIHAIENIGRATKKIHVSLPKITGLSSSSGAELTTINTIEAEKIYLDASSGADIQIAGNANMFFADASSGADIKAKNLMTKICNADASSGADISLNVSESLTADASSGADITYTGQATVQKSKSSSGSVHKY